MRFYYLFALVLVCSACSNDEAQSQNPELTRSFYMGFTAFPYDNTVDAQLDTFQEVNENGDIFLNHLDHGVPWDEALNDLPFPSEVQGTLEATKSGLHPNTKILLTATPANQTRENLAEYWNNDGSHQPLPQFWQGKTFDDPDVISAYTKYCKRIIDEVQPDYFAYGIEVTAAFKKGDTAFLQFLTLSEAVYSSLKTDYQNLPIFLTFQDRSFNNSRKELLEVTEMFLPYSDYIALSTYPFLDYQNLNREADPALFSDTWLDDFRNLDITKPFAISETGFCAEDLVIDNLGISIRATSEWQADYVTKLFKQANNLDAEFVSWFVYRDYDNLYNATPNPPDIFKVWRDNGLLDGDGNKRPAYATWQEWLGRTKR